MKRKYLFRFSLGSLLALTGVWLIKKKRSPQFDKYSSQSLGVATMRVDDDD